MFTKTDKTYHLDNSMSGMVIADLLNFLIDKKLPTFDYYKVEDSKVESLLMNLYLFQEFDSISHSLPIHIVNKQFQAHARGCIYLLLPPDSFEDFYKRNINHPQMNDENRKSWEQFRLLICNLMAGNLTDITQKADMNHSLGRYIHAYYHHLQGNLQSAIELYEDVIEHLPTKNILPANPLFAYSYALALLQDDSPRSRKKIAELLKKKDIKKAENYIPYLLLTLPGEVDENKRKKLAEIKNGEYQPLVVKLWVIILTYFDVPVDNTNIFDVNIISYNLLKLEESSVHSSCQKEYGRLSKKIGYTSLISRTHRLEEWEKVLNALNEPSLTGGKSMEETNQTETNRIIYLLEPQNLDITPVLQKSKNGLSWSKGRTISLERFGQGSMPEMNDVDRQVASCVKKNKSAYYYNSISYDMDTSQALLYLAGYPLVYLATNNDIPVEVVKGTPEMTLNRLKSGFTISLNIEADPQLINIVRENDTRIKVIALSIKQLHAVRLLASIKTLPLQAEEKLTQMLGNLNKIITIHSDLINNTADLKTEKADSRITVQLIPIGSTLKAELFVKPFTTEPPYCKAGVGAKSIVGTKDGKQVQMLRNFKKEKENYEIISGILQEISGNEDVEDSIVFKDSYSTLELLDALRAQPDITIIEWPEGARLRISHYADIDNLSLSLKKGKGNWFDIEGELNIGSNTLMTVKELLWKSRQNKGRFVQLNENEFLALSERLRKQLRELDSVASEDKGKLKVQEFASIAFDKWEEQGLALKVDKTYRALKERIAKAEEKTYDIPKQLNAELRDYQLTGFRWLARLADWGAGACLADDMGLGKTIQSIAILLHKAKEGASLVISPASVLLNWQTEISKFAPSLNILILNNAENRATMLEQADAYDVVLSTYGLLVTEGKQLAGKKWNVIILDEAHTIKNRDTKTSKAAMKLDAAFRIILTGTPIQNHLGEIWNLFQFINPG
ncbi:DEAD/DEAH box helicase, partial [Bacteroides sp. OttesenSCG-928-N06]|nr:DEAD/DEAH box helicase [Bacteroides sp. OttesenSCG-928-N06]